MEKIAIARGQDGYAHFVKHLDTEFDLICNKKNKNWRITFAQPKKNPEIKFKDRKEVFIELVSRFMKEYSAPVEIQVVLHSVAASLMKCFLNKWEYKVTSVKKIEATEESPETKIFFCRRRK